MSMWMTFKGWFTGGSNGGKQNKNNAAVDPDKPIKFNKRTDYADFACGYAKNPHVEAVIKEMLANSVGGAGISVTPQPLNDKGEIDKHLQAQLIKLWRDNKDKLDAGGRHSWAAMNQILAREFFAGGEVFLVKCISAEINNALKYGFMIKDYSALPFETYQEHKDGIRCTYLGKPISYMFSNNGKPKIVKAASVIHAANYVRCNDTRGYSQVAPACALAVELSQYDKDTSQLVKAAMRTAFVCVSKEEPQFPAGMPVIWIKGTKADTDFSTSQSQLVNSYSKDHRKNMHRSMCASVGTGYGAVSGEFDGSYSASRQEIITAAQKDLARQMQVINDIVKPLYEAFILRCMSLGLIKGYTSGDLFNARYVAPRREHIDPLKQAKTVALELATNQSTLADVLASKGKDFDTYIIHLKDELIKLKEAGLQPNGIEALKWLEINATLEDETDKV